MPIFMDRHELQGYTAEDVAMAHMRDLDVQDKYGVRYLTYWFDHKVGRAFCLVESPSREAAEAVHREAHGAVANEMIKVDQKMVEDFLGRIQDTSAVKEPSKPVSDGGFRTILFTDMKGSTALTRRLGDAAALEVLRTHNSITREVLAAVGGREVKHTGDGIMASLASVARALECAIAVQRKLREYNSEHPDVPIHVRIGLSAGEPVEDSDDIFGASVQLARRICDCAEPGQILVSNVVRELAIGKGFLFADKGEMELKGFEEQVRVHEVRWREDG
jgi:class 3 adenylate cyclase